ncbi:MAG: peroxiredoxin [Cyanobium sp.]
MKRRTLLRWLPQALAAPLLLTELERRANPAWAMGGELPALDAPAPPFELPGVAPSEQGSGSPTEVTIDLSSFHGRWLVLYFYPKDFTSGCTLEARGFQRDLNSFHRMGAEVVGISTDTVDSHGSFCGSEGLAYPLLSDVDGSVSRQYGSWLPGTALRHTFLIDPQGRIQARWVAVRPLGHSQEVLDTLTQLQHA